jgi:hypothetical protein
VPKAPQLWHNVVQQLKLAAGAPELKPVHMLVGRTCTCRVPIPGQRGSQGAGRAGTLGRVGAPSN